MNKYAGIWIDQRKAYIVFLNKHIAGVEQEEEETIIRIESEVEKHVRLSGGARTRKTPYGPQDISDEKRIEHRRENSLRLYYQEIIRNIQDARKASPVEAIIVPIVLMMIMFLMIMMSVPGMLNAVMEEKTQRIAEVMLGSVKPFDFMFAKLLGGIAVSLTSSLVYIVGGIAAVFYMGYTEFIPFHVLPWFFIYLVLAIVMFGAISSALGSTCNEPKDAQSLTFPSILPALIPMFIYIFVAKEPLSSFSTWMSLIPPFTPLLMVLRMSTPEQIPQWQPILGLIGVILFTIFFVWAGGRLFRVAILSQGTPPKLSNMLRWIIRG